MFRRTMIGIFGCLLLGSAAVQAADDLPDIKARGALRHLGVPYANFVTVAGDGFSVDMMKMFAARLGVRYEYVETDWGTAIPDLIGHKVKAEGDDAKVGETVAIRGDVIANGLTIIPWRTKVIRYSTPTFPTQVWLVARSDSPLQPIKPSGDMDKDIASVGAQLKGRTVLGMADTCLDPVIYGIPALGAKSVHFKGSLNDIASALMQGAADSTLIEVPEAFMALRKWPGMIKVIGPVSPLQEMGAGFRPDSPLLLAEFETFLKEIRANGQYRKLAEKYYPLALSYFPGFFD